LNTLKRKTDFEEKLSMVEMAIADSDGAKLGDDVAPLEHHFADGQYIRQITMPAGLLVTSAKHKTRHPFFVMSGTVRVISSEGETLIEAPYWGITEPGTKRLLYAETEVVWITVHATEQTDVDKLRDELTEPADELLEEIQRCHLQ